MAAAAAAAAAPHMGGSANSSSSSISPPAPSWHPVVLVPSYQQQKVLYDPDLATPSPSPTTPVATASPPRRNHLRPAPRCGGKRRRPRPSRKLPTTYISADAASFRRMVHQVTGADDALLLLPDPAALELLCRPVSATAAPSRGAGLTTTTTTETLLPTLDTSAFLMLGAAGGGRGGAAPAHPGPGVFFCHCSAVGPGAAALQVKAEACGGSGEFPGLESWDEDDALF